jgi:hypothetical protein
MLLLRFSKADGQCNLRSPSNTAEREYSRRPAIQKRTRRDNEGEPLRTARCSTITILVVIVVIKRLGRGIGLRLCFF